MIAFHKVSWKKKQCIKIIIVLDEFGSKMTPRVFSGEEIKSCSFSNHPYFFSKSTYSCRRDYWAQNMVDVGQYFHIFVSNKSHGWNFFNFRLFYFMFFWSRWIWNQFIKILTFAMVLFYEFIHLFLNVEFENDLSFQVKSLWEHLKSIFRKNKFYFMLQTHILIFCFFWSLNSKMSSVFKFSPSEGLRNQHFRKISISHWYLRNTWTISNISLRETWIRMIIGDSYFEHIFVKNSAPVIWHSCLRFFFFFVNKSP